jgi:tetratricopeptide (TPR) repeat protein
MVFAKGAGPGLGSSKSRICIEAAGHGRIDHWDFDDVEAGRRLATADEGEHPMNHSKKLFLSAVSSEFAAYRQLLAGDLKRPTLDVAVQEDFVVTGGSTLEKLDDYIGTCDGMIHLVGKATGSMPEEHAVAALLARYPNFAAKLPPSLAGHLTRPQPGFSYTQWEAYLALYHERKLFVYRPTDFELDELRVPRDPRFVFSPAEVQSQKEHYARICALGHDRGQFLNEERLSSAVLRDLVEILPRLETTIDVAPTKLRHTAERLIGRDEDLARLDAAWNDSDKNVVIVRAFGGMGKTSLVAAWMAELAGKRWRGAERVFDWTFYSQGTKDQGSASADSFIAAALKAFGDADPQAGSAWDRGARLAHLVGKQRCLLVLDGLEPLQYPPGPMHGKISDPGVEALLKGLAAQNAGLCVVTTREKIPDIEQHYDHTADDIELTALTDLAGAALLHYHGATRAGAKQIKPDDKELQAASHEVRGHGLTLQLLGQYLKLVEGGDIRKRDTVRLADADREYQNDDTRPYGHAFKAMEAYENWFQREGEKGQRQLAVLRLLGLFDRPASRPCLDALCKQPAIAGLTEPLVGLAPRAWALVASRLEEVNLLAVQADGSLDAHPLLREYFAQRLRSQQPEAWRAAHRRLYEHLCATTKEGNQPTLEDLQPLYQAVAHGCQAGLQQEACEKVYRDRLQRRNEAYSMKKLGALGSDLGAIACFFETSWTRVSPALTDPAQAWLLSEAAYRLGALGRLTEALEPMRAVLEGDVKQGRWKEAAISANNLGELELTLGEVARAVGDAEQSVTYADRSGDAYVRLANRATHADALHQAGRRAEAMARFREAEQIQAEREPDHPLLYSLRGSRYCGLLLAEAEREAWRTFTECGGKRHRDTASASTTPDRDPARAPSPLRSADALQSCRDVSERAAKALKCAEDNDLSLLTTALDHLTLGRAAFYAAILSAGSRRRESAQTSYPPPTPEEGQHGLTAAATQFDLAMAGFRRAGQQDHRPRGLLTRAWLRSLTGPRTGPDSAQSDLDEAWEIAERGPMPLLMADIHLYRARLFGEWPIDKRVEELKKARALIEKHGYWRRKEELEDAEKALGL